MELPDVRMEMRRLDAIRPYENNPRDNDAAVEYVANSIREHGFLVPIVVDCDGLIAAGDTRYKAAKLLGLEAVPCIAAQHLTPVQVKSYRLADNKVGEIAQWDYERECQELLQLLDLQVDMGRFGFDMAEFQTEAELLQDDFDGTLPAEPRARAGQVYQLGRHRLMCGDSTQDADVAKLMDGQQADLLLTDPPYNVDYEGGTPDRLKIANDNMTERDFELFIGTALLAADGHMRPGAAFYIWQPDSNSLVFRDALRNIGWQVRQTLVWKKNMFVLGRQDYQWKHEPCLYGWKGGAAHYFAPDRTLSTVVDAERLALDKMTKAQLRELAEQLLGLPGTVLEENKPTVSDLHPTMKPVPLMGQLMQNSTRRDWRVLDLFGGSGSTLIAAEQLGRICYMMECDPRYVDVIVDRWQGLTGSEAVLVSG